MTKLYPEGTLCGWQDFKIQSLVDFLLGEATASGKEQRYPVLLTSGRTVK